VSKTTVTEQSNKQMDASQVCGYVVASRCFARASITPPLSCRGVDAAYRYTTTGIVSFSDIRDNSLIIRAFGMHHQ